VSENEDIARAIKQAGLTGPVEVANCVVTAVAAGGATDGRAQVTISFAGVSIALPYLYDAYPTPAVNDVVQVLIVNNSPTIQGRVGGFPTY
jgi:hypothetical protein